MGGGGGFFEGGEAGEGGRMGGLIAWRGRLAPLSICCDI